MPKHNRTLDDILDPIAKGLTGLVPVPVPVPVPAPDPDPKIILDHVAEVPKNARAAWFGLLAFVGVTLPAHKDADFFAHGAETQLPLVGITVPVKAFFTVAPVLVAALYAYLRLYLMTLWDGLADAPARIGDRPLAGRVFPWPISHAALWRGNRRRGTAAPLPGCRVDWWPRSAGARLPLGAAVLTLLWWRSMPARDARP